MSDNIKNSNQCQFCNQLDTLEHFFYYCNEIKHIWDKAESLIAAVAGQRVGLSERCAMMGYSNKAKFKEINQIILITKMCISKYKFGRQYNLTVIFENECSLRS